MPNLLSWRNRRRTPEQYTFTPELRTALNKKMQNILATSIRDHEHAVYVELGLREVPALVTPTWRKHVPGGMRDREVGQDIYPIFEESEKLLIVGAPGAGKSIMLGRLCVELLLRAERDPHMPIAVIVNLASFSQHKGDFEAWLFKAMQEVLERPIEFCEMLYRGRHITLLFDGLDEVAPERRAACVAALNDLVPILSHIVVCCRLVEYENLETQLEFGSALVLQPISLEQAIDSLNKQGRATAGIRNALHRNVMFAELLETPLMLHVATIAFAHQTAVVINASSMSKLRTKLYTAYVRRMLTQRPLRKHTAQQAVDWLAWLGEMLHKQGAVSMQVELLQPTLLSTWWAFRIVWGTVAGLLWGVGAFAFLWQSNDFNSALFGGMIFGIVGALLGIFLGSQTLRPTYIHSMHHDEGLQKYLPRILKSGLSWGIIGGFIIGYVGGLGAGIWIGIMLALDGGLEEYIKHYFWRWFLYLEGKAPLRYVDFLENCCELLLLRRFGGAYQFYHITLRDYFANLTPEQIEEILRPDAPADPRTA